MLDNLFKGLFDTALTDVIGVTDFLLCLGFSLLICFNSPDSTAYHLAGERPSIVYIQPHFLRVLILICISYRIAVVRTSVMAV